MVIFFIAPFLAFLALAGARSNSYAAGIYVYRGAGCDGKSRVANFEQILGRKVDGVIDFTAKKDWSDLLSSSKWIAECWKGSGYKLSLSVAMLPDDKRTTMTLGAEGKYNGTFGNLASLLVKAGYGDASLRIGWEFNGNWYRWGTSTPGPVYRQYFRQIVSAMRKVEGQSFKFVWNPNMGMTADLEAYYPGDDVADIIGMDFYNQSWRDEDKDFKKRWANFEIQHWGLNWLAAFSAKHKKTIAFPEWGTGTRPDGKGFGDDPQFIDKMADWIAAHDVEFHGYWDFPAEDYNAALSNGSKPNAAEAFKRRFSK